MIKEDFIKHLNKCVANKEKIAAMHLHDDGYIRLIDTNNIFVCGDLPYNLISKFKDISTMGFTELSNNVFVSDKYIHTVFNTKVKILSNNLQHITVNESTRVLTVNDNKYIISNTDMFGYTLLKIPDGDYMLDYTNSNFNIIDEL